MPPREGLRRKEQCMQLPIPHTPHHIYQHGCVILQRARQKRRRQAGQRRAAVSLVQGGELAYRLCGCGAALVPHHAVSCNEHAYAHLPAHTATLPAGPAGQAIAAPLLTLHGGIISRMQPGHCPGGLAVMQEEVPAQEGADIGTRQGTLLCNTGPVVQQELKVGACSGRAGRARGAAVLLQMPL